MQTKQIAIGGEIVSYKTEGEGSDTIVFLHGWRSEGAAWLPAIGALGKRQEKIVIPDLPGFGMSPMQGKGMTLADYADIVRALVARECPDGNGAIIGHSFGARVAIKIAAENPRYLSRLVLVASGGARPGSIAHWTKLIAAKVMKPFFRPPFMQSARRAIYRMIGAEDYVMRPELKETLMNVLNEDIDGLCQKISTETLVIWGDEDDMAPLAYGKKMAGLIPGAKMEIMEGTGHWCFRERPGEFARIVGDFLK